jgi:hypothetical protein
MRYLFASIMTLVLVGWSATLNTGIGGGAYLLATIPLSPVIFGLMLWIGTALGIEDGLYTRAEDAPPPGRFVCAMANAGLLHLALPAALLIGASAFWMTTPKATDLKIVKGTLTKITDRPRLGLLLTVEAGRNSREFYVISYKHSSLPKHWGDKHSLIQTRPNDWIGKPVIIGEAKNESHEIVTLQIGDVLYQRYTDRVASDATYRFLVWLVGIIILARGAEEQPRPERRRRFVDKALIARMQGR